MDRNVSIVFLWAEVVGYLQAVLNSLSSKASGNISVVHWDKRDTNTTQYNIDANNNVSFYGRSETDNKSILELLNNSSPEIIVISGWMDKGYIWACKKYKKANPNVKIVAGIDDMWTGALRQRLGQIYYRLFYRHIFDFMWISGQPQYSFAQRFGYGIENIISNLYSADTMMFTERAEVSKRFIFVGRFVKIKALDLLVQAYCRLPKNIQDEWPLVLIGDGEQKSLILAQKNPNIMVISFLQPDELRKELLKGGVGCLPTHKDQWGVVLHEFALMGLPMLVSSGCGASTEFLISGFNGFMFKKNDVDDLFRAMTEFTCLTNKDYLEFSENSRKLGCRITSEISASSLLSVSCSIMTSGNNDK